MPPNTEKTSSARELSNYDFVSPTIRTLDGEKEVQPIAATRQRGKIKWRTDTSFTLSGDARTNNDGVKPTDLTLEGVLFKGQLEQLLSIASQYNEVKFISDSFTRKITFSNFMWERTDEQDRGTFTLNGEHVTQPIYTFQLQKKEKNSDGGFLDTLANG